MTDILEEYITLTPLTCAQQVNALLDAASPQPRSCKVIYTLFGVYCGILAFREYRRYIAKRRRDGVADVVASLSVDNEATETVSAASYESAQLPSQPSPILLQPVDYSNTDLRWRYGPQTLSEFKDDYDSADEDDEEPFEKPIRNSNEEPEVATVSVGTSTMGTRVLTREDKIKKESTKATTISMQLD